jgi:imidazolonepropionase-like amidohydrolase
MILKMSSNWHTILTATIGLLITAIAHSAERPLVIENTTIFDATSKKMIGGQTVVLKEGRFAAVGPAGSKEQYPDGAEVIDGRGKFVIPGLIDAHVHLVHRIDYAHVTGDEILPLFLTAGVTSVRSTGDEIIAQTVVAHFAESHPDTCPRVFLASGLIDGNPPIHKDIGIPITDPAKVPELVAEMAAWKVTTLKIYAGQVRPVGREVIREGHRRGMVVTGHLGRYTAQEAIEDGIDCLEHITSVFDFAFAPDAPRGREGRANLDLQTPQARALIASLVENGVMVDPTLTVYKNMLLLSDLEEIHNHADNALMPERLKEHWTNYRLSQGHTPGTRELRQKEFARYQALTGELYRAGVPLLVGTDAAEPYCPPGWSLHQEMELLVESGMSAADVLAAATLQNARVLKADEELGSITAGKRADCVILDADPTADIRHTRRIHGVIHHGLVCNRAAALRMVPKR